MPQVHIPPSYLGRASAYQPRRVGARARRGARGSVGAFCARPSRQPDRQCGKTEQTVAGQASHRICVYARIYTHSRIHLPIHYYTNVHPRRHPRRHTCMQTHTHTYIHTYIHTGNVVRTSFGSSCNCSALSLRTSFSGDEDDGDKRFGLGSMSSFSSSSSLPGSPCTDARTTHYQSIFLFRCIYYVCARRVTDRQTDRVTHARTHRWRSRG